MKKPSIIAAVCMVFGIAVFAEDTDKTVTYTTKISTAIAYPLEAVIGITEHIAVPAMNFNHPLTRNNNVTFKIGGDISPVSMEGKFDIVWTPIAFLELYAGVSAGSGWNIGKLNILGLALNTKNNRGNSKYTPINLTRTFYSGYVGGAFQFDLGAVVPGDWTHLVCRIDQYAVYKGISGTNNLTSWVWKHDSGQNRNGWRYNAGYILGYQMPIPLNFIAMRVETEKTFFAVPAGRNKREWGEDRIKVTFGPLFNFKVNDILDILLLAQFETKHVSIISETVFYQNRFIETSQPDTVRFKRVAALFNVSLKHR